MKRFARYASPWRGALQGEWLETRRVMADGDGLSNAPLEIGPKEYWVPPVSAAIVNGTDAGPQFPSVGALGDFCTGTLISADIVLTAGHCVFDTAISTLEFEIGGLVYSTAQVFQHPAYDNDLFDSGFDLALLKLSEPVEGVVPSDILRTPPIVGETLTLVGFGETGSTAQGSNFDFGKKQFATTPLQSLNDIHLLWQLDSPEEGNTAPGDSGGPAFVLRDGNYVVAGVTSGGDLNPFELNSDSFDTRIDKLSLYIDSVVGGGIGTEDDHPNILSDAAFLVPLDDAGRGALKAHFNGLNDADVFRLDLPGRTGVTVDLTLRPIGAKPSIYFYSADGVEIPKAFEGSETRQSALLPTGTSYLVLESEIPGDYAFSISSLIDDQTIDPAPFDLSQGKAMLRGSIDFATQPQGFSGDRDEFTLLLAHEVELSFTLTADANGKLDTFLRIFDDRGVLVGFNNDVAPPNRNSAVTRTLGPGNYRISVASYLDRSVGKYTLTAEMKLRGDTNGDYRVDLRDFVTLRTTFGQRGPGLAADLNKDERVNLADFEILRSAFGISAAAIAPKPASFRRGR